MQALLRAGQEATFRDSYARMPYSRVSQFLTASFARNRRFRDFLKFGTFGGCASGERAGEYSESSRSTLSVNGYPNRLTLGASVLFCCSGTGLGAGVPPSGPPPAVRSDGWTALHEAAANGNRRIVRSLVASGAVVDARNRHGCAVCALRRIGR